MGRGSAERRAGGGRVAQSVDALRGRVTSQQMLEGPLQGPAPRPSDPQAGRPEEVGQWVVSVDQPAAEMSVTADDLPNLSGGGGAKAAS
eukprot:gene10220-5632_t